jgi:rhodanese-related sulfurtransferase
VASKRTSRRQRLDNARRTRELAQRRLRRRWWTIGISAASLIALAVVGVLVFQSRGDGGSLVTPLTPRAAAELAGAHAGDAGFVTLDIRTAAEFAGGHLRGATNIDYYDSGFQGRLDKLDKAKTYLVYCHTGNRSGKATALMRGLGFARVYDLRGGIAAWQQAGLPVTS